MTRIASGVVDQGFYFVAVDATDLKTRETGLTSFTVYRERNNGTAAAMTTPTVTEVDATNLPGVYFLLCDEDMTIDAGDDDQEMVYHITQAAMAPVTKTITVYRPKATVGNTLDVTSGGNAGIDADNIALTNGAPAFGIQASGTLSGTHSSTTADLGTNAPSQDIAGMTLNIPSRGFSRVISSYNTGTGVATWLDATSETLTNADPWYLFGTGLGNALDAAGIRSALGLASANLDTQLATLATAAALEAVDNFLDTEIAAILADTDELQTDWVNGGRLDLLIDAIKAKTDSLTFTQAGHVDANVQRINDVTITGNGGTGTEFSV